MSKIDLIDNNWVELVFEGKNKEYGAYVLRKDTGKRNLQALAIVIAVIAAIFIGVIAKVAIQNAMPKKVAITTDVELSQLAQKKEAKVERKEPVKVEMEQKVVEKVKSSVKFTAPEIKKDDEVKPEDELKSQDELAKSTTAIGSFDVKGNDEAEGEVLKAKEVIADEKPKEEEKPFDIVEQMPTFPGGDGKLMEWLSKNIKYPAVAEENGVQGRVIVRFVVGKDGSISNASVVRSVDPSLDKEALRVVKAMPRWIPGKQNGAAVPVWFTLPVTFQLQ
ncbi:MAG: TonB family protein [Prevotella sp.]|nr:TonB family protein [Prevotella sp.]